MKKKPYFILAILILIITSYGCSKKENEVVSEKSINGTVQKGPFLNGSSITVFELDQQYTQTGNSYSTQISDNLGNFQLNNISLASNYVRIRADGYYFNEICGSNSTSPITLNCISNIINSASVHINILTHLEKPRVEHLLSTGMSLESAKKQAQQEILDIFDISSQSIQNSEDLDISQGGDGNGILLAISSILQGFRTESELSVLLSVISNDISNDGTLDDSNIKSSLIDHAILLDTLSIRNNVSTFYNNLGINATIPPFEKYIAQFITNSTFPITNSVFNYPPTGLYGSNVLFKSQMNYGLDVSFAGQGKKCSFLKIRIKLISGSMWATQLGTSDNVIISSYDDINNEQFFTIIDPSLPFDVNMVFNGTGDGGTYLIEYFEKDTFNPVFSKTISAS